MALKTKSNYFFIGADNGIFYNVLSVDEIEECVILINDNYFNKPVSNTFHGRDIMAPVAAHIISGIPLNNFGPSFDPNNFMKYPIKFGSSKRRKSIDSTIQYVDSFGNGITNISLQDDHIYGTSYDLNKGKTIKIKLQNNSKEYKGEYVSHFAEVPINTLLFLKGSSGFLEISINQGNAAATLGFKVGDLITFFLD